MRKKLLLLLTSLSLAMISACATDKADHGVAPSGTDSPSDTQPDGAEDKTAPPSATVGNPDGGASDAGKTPDASPPAATPMAASIVRSNGWPFTIANGILYRLDVTNHKLYAGDVDDPTTDHVLSDVGALGAIDIAPLMVVTSTHVVLSRGTMSASADEIRRVPIAGGATTTLSFSSAASPWNRLGVNGTDAVFGAKLPVAGFRIDRLAANTATWSPWFTSTHVDGPSNDVVDTFAFAMDSGTTFYGVHLYNGPYVGNAANQSYTFLGAASWDSMKLGAVAGANVPLFEVARRGNRLDVLQRDPRCNALAPVVPAKVSTWDLDKIAAPTAVDIPAGAHAMVAGSSRVFVESWCDGTVTSIDPSTGASSNYARPRINPVPSYPANDVYDWQFRWPLAVDGGWVYFLHMDTLRRTPKL